MTFFQPENLSSYLFYLIAAGPILFVAFIFYKFVIRTSCLALYYRYQGVPFVFSNPFEFAPHWLHERRAEFSRKYQKYFIYPVGPFPVLTLIDPNLIKDYLIRKGENFVKLDPGTPAFAKLAARGIGALEGAEWKSERKILNGAFHHKNLIAMIGKIENQCNSWINNIKGQVKSNNGNPIDIRFDSSMDDLTLEVLTVCTMGGMKTTVESKGKEVNLAYLVRKMLDLGLKYALRPTTLLFPQRVNLNWDEETREFNATVDLVRQAASEILTKRIETLMNDPSLLDTQYDLVNLMIKGQCSKASSVEQGLASLDMDMLIDNLSTFFLAGSETSSIALTWLFYHVTKHPEVLSKMRAELDSVFGDAYKNDPENFITEEGLNKLDYVVRVIKETLRIVPPTPRTLARVSVNDVKIGNLNVKKGTLVSVEPYLIHHNEALWENPEEFNPDRKEWVEGNVDLRFIPFSAGKRNCIGQFFALMQLKVLVSKLMMNLDVKCQEDAMERIKLGFTVSVKNGMFATVQDLHA